MDILNVLFLLVCLQLSVKFIILFYLVVFFFILNIIKKKKFLFCFI